MLSLSLPFSLRPDRLCMRAANNRAGRPQVSDSRWRRRAGTRDQCSGPRPEQQCGHYPAKRFEIGRWEGCEPITATKKEAAGPISRNDSTRCAAGCIPLAACVLLAACRLPRASRMCSPLFAACRLQLAACRLRKILSSASEVTRSADLGCVSAPGVNRVRRQSLSLSSVAHI